MTDSLFAISLHPSRGDSRLATISPSFRRILSDDAGRFREIIRGWDFLQIIDLPSHLVKGDKHHQEIL
jgi:hypothetical protein